MKLFILGFVSAVLGISFYELVLSLCRHKQINNVCKNIHKEEKEHLIQMDPEVAIIALDNIKRELRSLISPVEKRALDYSIESIEIRNKIDKWIKDNEKNTVEEQYPWLFNPESVNV